MPLTISIDSSGAQAVIGTLPRRLRSGTATAINKTVTRTRAFMVKAIAEMTGLPPLYVSPALKTVRASGERLEGEVNAATRMGARMIPILQLRARQLGRGPSVPGGVSFQFAGQTKTLPNAFIATMRSGHRGVFTRVGRSRLPIIEEKGPAMRTVFELAAEKGRAFAQQDLIASMARELDKVARGA